MAAVTERGEQAWSEDSIRLFATPSPFARSTLFYVQEIGHFYARSGYFTEREHLNSYLVVYTVGGSGQLIYEDSVISLPPHHLFFIDCTKYQHYGTASNEGWELLWIHMNGPSMHGYYEQFRTQDGPVRSIKGDGRITRIMREILDNHQVANLRTEFISSRLIVDLLTELLLIDSASIASGSTRPSFVANAVRHMDNGYQEKITLELLAQQFAVNKYYLAKEFKRHTGYSPGEYLISTRINKAKELLKYTGHSIADIAEQVGISNVSHFIHLFKSRVEETPLTFRKHWQNSR